MPSSIQLCDRADLDTSFSHFKNVFYSVLLDFQSFTKNPAVECPFAHPMILFLSNLIKNCTYCVSVVCKLAME